MDEIQKILVKAGRKDLAQEYYQKTSIKKDDFYPKKVEKLSLKKIKDIITSFRSRQNESKKKHYYLVRIKNNLDSIASAIKESEKGSENIDDVVDDILNDIKDTKLIINSLKTKSDEELNKPNKIFG